MVNSHLVCDPTIWQLGFDLPRQQWSLLNRFRTEQTLRCLQKEMATYRHWSMSLWRDPYDVSHCRILFPDKTEWRLISATLCGWRRCFVADQLWFMTRIREEEEDAMASGWWWWWYQQWWMCFVATICTLCIVVWIKHDWVRHCDIAAEEQNCARVVVIVSFHEQWLTVMHIHADVVIVARAGCRIWQNRSLSWPRLSSCIRTQSAWRKENLV